MSRESTLQFTTMQYHALHISPPSTLFPAISDIGNLEQSSKPAADQAQQTWLYEKRNRELELQLAEHEEKAEVRVEEARQEGRAMAREEAKFAEAELVKDKVGQITRALEAFHYEQKAYFARIEPQVVDLSLAIAARILRREAQMDPLLLAGVVTVALKQLQNGTESVLRVPSADEQQWRDWASENSWSGVQVCALEGGANESGECRLETRLGHIDLGVTAQLKEIERGFFDILQQRPVLVEGTPSL